MRASLIIFAMLFGITGEISWALSANQKSDSAKTPLNIKLSNTDITNGKSILIQILPKDLKISKIQVRFGDKDIPVFKHPKVDAGFYAIVGVPFKQPTSEVDLSVLTYAGEQKLENKFKIKVKNISPEPESISVDPVLLKPIPTKVEPGSKEEFYKKRSEELKEFLKFAYTDMHTDLDWQMPFLLPIDSVVTSQFGGKRFINKGVLKSYHMGTDFRAARNTPVRAPNSGIVKFDYYLAFGGNTIIIEHGQGLTSTLGHLEKMLVTKGDEVKRGQIIGLSGASGRVTGPHLHLEMRVHGEIVDSVQLIDLIALLFPS